MDQIEHDVIIHVNKKLVAENEQELHNISLKNREAHGYQMMICVEIIFSLDIG